MDRNENLLTVLERARSLGFLGPAEPETQISHALSYAEVLRHLAEKSKLASIADLGAGAGLPSLPVLLELTSINSVLVDASEKRCAFLRWAMVELNLTERMEVRCGRAETFGHEQEIRGQFDAVVARGFGPPSSTIECALGYLREGGHLLISEPPQKRRWPVDDLAAIGLHQVPCEPLIACFELRGEVDSKYPRRAKAQQAKPLLTL